MTETTGRFDLTRWDEEPYDDAEGARLVTVVLEKTFQGGITGTSSARLLQAFAQEGAAAYVGIERVTATVDGREGTFVLRHSALGDATGGDMRIDVLPGSGTGGLRGLRGELAVSLSPEGEHAYTLRYDSD